MATLSHSVTATPHDERVFVRRTIRFVGIGLILYAGLYMAAESLLYRYAAGNRFFAIRTAPAARFDYVILGASHAAALDYGGMTGTLDRLTQARTLNLAIVGAGVSVNRLVFDYFLQRHEAGAVVYVVDAFAFEARSWNEDRLRDTRLFVRAPFDWRLASLLARAPGARLTALDYISGFSKINNPDRFAPDDREGGARFERVYRPVKQIDEQRVAYLYPDGEPRTTVLRDRYLAQFEDLLGVARAHAMRVLIVKPPIPERMRRLLPDQGAFDAALSQISARQSARLHDFSGAANEDRFFYDSDHLNRAGVQHFFETALAPAMLATAGDPIHSRLEP